MLKVVTRAREGEGALAPRLLDELARAGAQAMLHQALEAEVAAYLERHQERDARGHALVVRNGKARPRQLTCGAGTLTVASPRVNDRRRNAQGRRQRFTSRILPPYMRRSPRVAEVLPVLYLRGLSTGDFQAAPPILLGEEAAGPSPTNIARLTGVWEAEYRAFRQRSLADRDYAYVWVDRVHFTIRLEDERLCTVVMVRARPDGAKELIAVEDSYRESAENWAELLRDLKRRGMRAPVVAVGDGALGFWAAAREVWPQTASNETGATRSRTSWTSCPKACSPSPSGRCAR
jgi:transposase-like protein